MKILNMCQKLAVSSIVGLLLLLTSFIATAEAHSGEWHITDNATGGDCSLIGNWDITSKTCTLTQDLNQGVVIDSNNLVLDGNGHMVSRIAGTGYGVYLSDRTGVTIKNFTIEKFFYGIYLDQSSNNILVNNTSSDNSTTGIYISRSSGNTLTNNTAQENLSQDLYVQALISSHCNNNITNTIGSGNRPIKYFNAPVNLDNETLSELILCNADGSSIRNITIDGSVTKKNNSLFLIQTSTTTISNTTSSNNLFGINLYLSDNNILRSNNTSNNRNPGIFLDQSSNNTLTNNNTSNGDNGIVLENSSHNNILIDNIASSNARNGVSFFKAGNNTLTGNIISNNRFGINFQLSSNNILTGNTISSNYSAFAFFIKDNSNKVYKNNFIKNQIRSYVSSDSTNNIFNLPSPDGGNYWSNYDEPSEGCNDANNDNFCDSPYVFSGGQDNLPWTTQDGWNTPPCTTNCYSNVLFLPGIKGSRLYRAGNCGQASAGECRLWEPDNDTLAQELSSTPTGSSTNPNIYTRDVIDEAYKENLISVNIYKSFIDQMSGLATAGTINEFESIPYDWRLSYEDILGNGKKTGNNISYIDATSSPYIIQELRRLAKSSKSGKVTIVAHSTGGLLTKMLTNTLGGGASQLIDRIIFVDVPQTGTPQGIAAMLFGHEQKLPPFLFPTYISGTVARDLSLHYPSAYNLLPSSQYFTDIDNPVIEFGNDPLLAVWRNNCGSTVHSTVRLRCVLTDQGGRNQLLVAGVLNVPPILESSLFDQAQVLHDTSLDHWAPPTGIMLTQIAGWGIPTTVASSTLEVYTAPNCENASLCPGQTTSMLVPDYHFTVDGDGTVVTPSALATQVTGGRFWVNLEDYNGFFVVDREHGDILEVPDLRTFIQNLITNNTAPLPELITAEAPVSTAPRLRYTLHSPLSLNAYDNEGRHTGISTTTGAIEEQIPGAYFLQMGEVKYLFTNASSTTHIIMNGTASSTFTLEVEELTGDTLTASTTWKNMPVTPDTTATLTTLSDITTLSPLTIDKNSDGIIDYTIVSKLNDTTVFDITPPEVTLTLDPISQKLKIIGTDNLSSTTILTTATSTTIIDEAGNTFEIIWKKLKQEGKEIKIELQELRYNGASTGELPKTVLQYEWSTDKTGNIKELEQKATVGELKIKAHYDTKKNVTKVEKKLPEDTEDSKETLSGLVIINLTTNKGKVGVNY